MAATLANRGINPVTGVQVITPNIVARTLSVMTSSGKCTTTPASGPIASAFPPRAASAAASSRRCPRSSGSVPSRRCSTTIFNSVRGLKVCEALSARFDLHMLNRNADVRTSIMAGLRHLRHFLAPQPSAARAADPRRASQRHPCARAGRRDEFRHHRLRHQTAEQRAAERAASDHRLPPCPRHHRGRCRAARRYSDRALGNAGVTTILSGFEATSPVWSAISARTAEPRRLRRFALLDDAIEWAEDQVDLPLRRLHRREGERASQRAGAACRARRGGDRCDRRSCRAPGITRLASASSRAASPPIRCSFSKAGWSA